MRKFTWQGGLNVANAVLQGAEEEEVAYKEDSDHWDWITGRNASFAA
jgi:hypothetical protein